MPLSAITKTNTMSMKRLADIALALAVAWTTMTITYRAPEAATACKEKRIIDGHHWSWRIVDGEKCWYRGARRLSKAKLYWPDDEPIPKVIVRAEKPKPLADAMYRDCVQLRAEGCDR